MIWSVIPEEIIFKGAEDDSHQQISYLGRQILVRDNQLGQKEIISISSSDPNDFLSPRFLPGTVINIG